MDEVPAEPLVPGILLAHKPVGGTSFQMVRHRMWESRQAGQKKFPVGHGGTLDPFAEGLLLLLQGQATRLMDLMHPLPKTYEALVAWGVETDTCDLQGKPVSEGDASRLTPVALDAALAGFLGWHDQVPPATSAKRIDGERAYAKAHRGEEVVLPPSRVYLHTAEWLAHDLPATSRLRITCRGGFYVRSLARDLGRALGCGAHLRALHRTAIGPWVDPGLDCNRLVQGESLIPWCPTRHLDDIELDHLLHGRRIGVGRVEPGTWALPEGFPDPGAPIRGLHSGKLVALLREEDGSLRTVANLRGGL
ncbi:MAG TPA: tRNA pseudouridine(55) synthase TruB [Holophagaceae bacterium]|nr:tRNA pseudouridine(55) synthase TruB [Holophagaceae bacterium]